MTDVAFPGCPENGVYGKFEVSTHAFGADEARSNLRRYNVAFGGGITPQWARN